MPPYLLVFFVWNENRAKHPLIPLSIFKIRNLSGADTIQLFTAAGLFSVFFFVTLYVQEILGYSPVRTGLSFLVIPVVIALVATNTPKLIQRIGYKPILVVAPLFTATGLFLLGHNLTVHNDYWGHLVPGMVVMGFGLGATFVSVLVAATSGVPGHLSGLASGLVNTAQQIGGSLGLAVLSGIAASSAMRYAVHAHAQNTAAIAVATVHGYKTGFYVAVASAYLLQ